MDVSDNSIIRLFRRYRETILDLLTHFGVTLGLAWFFYMLTGGWSWPALAVLGGVFIDLDHFIDYFGYFGWKFDLKAFFEHGYMASGKVYVFFHSWELVVILWTFSLVLPWAIPLHLLIDVLFAQHSKPEFMSLIYRASKNFDLDQLCPEMKAQYVGGRKIDFK